MHGLLVYRPTSTLGWKLKVKCFIFKSRQLNALNLKWNVFHYNAIWVGLAYHAIKVDE